MANSFQVEAELPEMESIANLAENLVYRLPGVSDLMVRKTLQEVYRDFCRRSCCLKSVQKCFLEEGQSTICVGSVYSGTVDCITEVSYDRRLLEQGRDYHSRDNVIVLDRRLVIDSYPGDEKVCVRVSCVEIPNINSEESPSWFLQKYGDAICSGVIFRIMSQTGKVWSDAGVAAVENQRYENAITEARMNFYAGGNFSSGGYGTVIDPTVLI